MRLAADNLLASPETVMLGTPEWGEPRYSTVELLGIEAKLLAQASAGKAGVERGVPA